MSVTRRGWIHILPRDGCPTLVVMILFSGPLMPRFSPRVCPFRLPNAVNMGNCSQYEGSQALGHPCTAVASIFGHVSLFLFSSLFPRVCLFRLPQAVVEEVRKSNRTSTRSRLSFGASGIKKEKDAPLAWTFDQVHLLQSDIVGFTKCASVSHALLLFS